MSMSQFTIGTEVEVVDPDLKIGMSTQGLQGWVKMTDEKSGVCVALFISFWFKPCFWYRPNGLIIREPGSIKPAESSRIKLMAVRVAMSAYFTAQLKRSWLTSLAGSTRGSALHTTILALSSRDVERLFESQERATKWLQDNDRRVKRPKLLELSYAELVVQPTRRTKIV